MENTTSFNSTVTILRDVDGFTPDQRFYLAYARSCH